MDKLNRASVEVLQDSATKEYLRMLGIQTVGKLQRHRKKNNGLNIWTCDVKGPRKSRRIHGYLLEELVSGT